MPGEQPLAGRSLGAASLPLIGWREWVRLGCLGNAPLKAKVDTGAATSCLHAIDLIVTQVGSGMVARFDFERVEGGQRETVALPIVGTKQIRSSNGQAENRPIVRTFASIGQYRFPLDLTLTERYEMGFPMLVGRRALKGRFLVDAGRSFLASESDVAVVDEKVS